MTCVFSLIKKFESEGFSHTEAISAAWETKIALDKIMAPLSTSARKNLPKGSFGKPSTRSPSGGQGGWPLNDCKRAKAAKTYYGRFGKGDQKLKSRINAKLKQCGLSPIGETTVKKESHNWDGANLDDPGRARDEGVMEGEDKRTPDQKVESCVKQQKAKGMDKSKAFAICNSSVKGK